MKVMFCWRCGIDVPMLDEEEFAQIHTLYARAMRTIKDETSRNAPTNSDWLKEIYRPTLDGYAELTGYRETNLNALMHHRLSIYGPICTTCGKPHRTPRAQHCAACGAERRQ